MRVVVAFSLTVSAAASGLDPCMACKTERCLWCKQSCADPVVMKGECAKCWITADTPVPGKGDYDDYRETGYCLASDDMMEKLGVHDCRTCFAADTFCGTYCGKKSPCAKCRPCHGLGSRAPPACGACYKQHASPGGAFGCLGSTAEPPLDCSYCWTHHPPTRDGEL
jgi:hypothetical protein